MFPKDQYKALKEKRALLIDEQSKIFQAVNAEAREFTDAERQRDDAIVAELATVNADLARHERRRELEKTGPGVPLTSVNGLSGGDEMAAEKPFKTMAENARAAFLYATTHELPVAYKQYQANLQRTLALTGSNETVGSEGGVLVHTDFVSEVLKPVHEDGPFSKAIRMMPVSADANGIAIAAVDETSRANGSRWGGVLGYRLEEGGEHTLSQAKFKRVDLRLRKYGVFMKATDEVVKDASALEAIITQSGGEELSFLVNDDILNGPGSSGALGVLNGGSLVTVSKETGQAAATFVNRNINKMWQRLHPRFRASSAWYINGEVEPQLDELSIPAGTAALEPRYVTYGPDGVMRIKGRPVVVTEFNAALGTVGDVVLASFAGDYVGIEKGGVQLATSIHLYFLTDQQAFRMVYRFYGQPLSTSAITPYKGSNTQSAFVALETRS